MRFNKISLFVAGAALAMSLQAQSVDELIAKNIAAKGGAEKMKALKSMKATGKMTVGPMEAPFTYIKKRPGSMRIDFTVQGMTGSQAFDGSNGWSLMPFMGKNDPEKMSADEVKEFSEQADFDGPLVDYKAKGNKVELVGKEAVEGTQAYKLKLTMKNGNETIVYLDADSFLEIRQTSKRQMQGQDVETELAIGDYKDEGGFLMAHSMEQTLKSAQGTMKQTFVLDKVEVNSDVDDAIFKMPEVKKAAEAPKAKS